MLLDVISKKFTENTLDEIVKAKGGSHHTAWKWNNSDGPRKGDSYLSEIYRIIIDGVIKSGDDDQIKQKLQIHVIIKALPKNLGRRKTFRSVDFFHNECNFFNIVLKKYSEFQQKKNIKNPLTETPICLYSYFDGDNDFIVLEDLSVDGYDSATRQNGVDLNHCKLMLQCLGKFHAVSLAIKDQEPDEFHRLTNFITETYYDSKYKKWYEQFMDVQISVATDAIEKEYGGTLYERKMKEFTKQDLYEKMIELTHANGPYSVIGHGDCWLPNFLMKYDNVNDSDNDQKIPIAIKMIDFQLVRYASPALDISFLIYSCTTQMLREKHYNELLEVYYTAAKDLLIELGSDPQRIFPYASLLDEMKKYARFGVSMSMESIPLTIMDDSETADLDTIKGDEAVPLTSIWIVKPIKTKEGRLRIADAFKHAIDAGYLED